MLDTQEKVNKVAGSENEEVAKKPKAAGDHEGDTDDTEDDEDLE